MRCFGISKTELKLSGKCNLEETLFSNHTVDTRAQQLGPQVSESQSKTAAQYLLYNLW